MWKFSELPYERVDVDKFIADGLKLIEAFENAKTAQEAIDAYYAMDEASQKVATMFTISHIRHDVNTKDEFYDAEQTYYDQNLSKTMVLNDRIHGRDLQFLRTFEVHAESGPQGARRRVPQVGGDVRGHRRSARRYL